MFKKNKLVLAFTALTCFLFTTLNFGKAYGVKSPAYLQGSTSHLNVFSSIANQQPSPKVQAGKDLMDKSDCKVCHSPDQKLIGPSFVDIATKYKGKAGIAAKLADKVIEGGSGVWGPIPMTPHPQLTKKDAELMVGYILTAKK